MKIKSVFARQEKKYLMGGPEYVALRQTLSEHMSADEYGKHTICNLYLDTPDYALIRASLEKPVYKEKLRLRSYGVPSEGDTVFLELKKKCGGTVFKRRAALPLTDARRYLEQGDSAPVDSQIMRELDWAIRRYQPVPTVFIAYDRVALTGLDDPELRITFDTNLRCRRDHLSLTAGAWGSPLLGEDQFLMEVKTLGAMPLWLSHRLAELGIFPTSFSKYGTFYQEHLSNSISQRGANCA